MPIELAWLIPGLPVLSFAVLILFPPRQHKLAGYFSILCTGGSFVLSLLFFGDVLSGGPSEAHSVVEWLHVGSFQPEIGVWLVPVSYVMIVVVTTVSLLVQIYSQGYMHGDPGYPRYFAFMSLFTFSMLGLVLAGNLLQLFIFWEGVGVCSYLLIGYWWEKPEAAMAAKKAFVTTRIGDLGMVFGLLLLFSSTGTLEIEGLVDAVKAGTLGGATLSWALIGLFGGAIGKSAQFPLHVWLPDAMEGPTPVSALIHAATMVAAGVYLVARLFELYVHASTPVFLGLTPLELVAAIGGITAIFAATMGLVMNDIKRVMAYSTVSQLGYMMLALGVGGLVAGMFHLFTHAFFKALLFLGSGSVIHGTGTQDMREMGGLRKHMPWTFGTLGIASLALAGIPPFAGFFSKDEILGDALHHGQNVLFWLGVASAFMTAFYVTRMMVLTFLGQYRGPLASHGPGAMHVDEHAGDSHDADRAAHGGGHTDHAHGHGTPHESPPVMLIPLVVLAVMSILAGFFNWPEPNFALLLGEHGEPIDPQVATISVAVAMAGIIAGLAVYLWRVVPAEALGRLFGPIYTLVANKYYVDELYCWLLDVFVIKLSFLFARFDLSVIDGIVNDLAEGARGLGAALRRVQSGQVQLYALISFAGIAIIIAAYWITGSGVFSR